MAFIPEDRREAMARSEVLPDRAVGVALFADLSGFTALTEALTQAYGPQRGAEELTRVLAQVYGELIAAVDDYRGSVIGFSGDAITCWFDLDTGPRAVSCGLAMQAAMGRFKSISLPGGEAASLAVKVAAVEGPVRRFLVGDPAVQLIDVLAGATLDALAEGEGLASSGEVLFAGQAAASDPAWKVAEWRTAASGRRFALIRGAAVTARATPWPAVAEESLTEAEVARWVLPVIHDRMRQGLGGFLADFRPAAALFLSFRGISYDADDAAGEKLDRFVRWVQARVAALEGSLIQLTIGDKGSYLYAAFGAPIAHDDDPVRAVAVAKELLVVPPDLDFVQDVRIGVTQGQMYTGAYGSPTRSTYGVLGAKTNLAARLMKVAVPGEVVCDEEIFRHARRAFSFVERPPVKVKGKKEPVRIFVPTTRSAAIGDAGGAGNGVPIVGRAADLRQLAATLDDLQAGRGRVTFLVGDAGIGKSRLVAELSAVARSRGTRVMTGAGRSVAQEAPYHAWRELLSAYFGFDAAEDDDERRARVREAAERAVPEMGELVPLLNDVLGLDLPETAASSALDSAARQEGLYTLLIALLRRAAAREPLLLVVDDAHWLDSLSWELAERVSRALGPDPAALWLLIVHRPLEEHNVGARAASLLGESPHSDSLALGPLSAEELGHLVAQRLEVPRHQVPAVVAELVVERAGGNPFIAEELVQTLQDQALLRVEEVDGERQCRVSPALAAGRFSLPDTLQGLILSRLDRLQPDRQLVLKVASVIGRVFASSPLRDTLGQLGWGRRSLRPTLFRDLTRRGFIQPEAAEPELSYLFRHVITHEVVYQTLLFAQRRQVHQAVAEWYERAFPDRLGDLAALLAHHWSRAAEGTSEAGLLEKAVHYLTLSGSRASRLGAFPEAISTYQRGLSLLPGEEAWTAARAQLLVSLGQVQERMGDYPLASMHLHEALALAQAAGEANLEADALTWLTSIALRQGAYDEAERLGERALEVAQNAQDGAAAAAAQSRLGILAAYRNSFEVANQRLSAALEYYREVDDSAGVSHILNSLGVTAIFENDYPKAGEYFEQALALARELGDMDSIGRCLNNLGLVAENRADYDAARRYYEESRAISVEIGSRQGVVTNLLSLGDVAAAQQRYDEAEQYFLEALGEATGLGALPLAVAALCGMASLLATHGELARAVSYLGVVLAHPATNTEVEQKAAPLLQKLRESMPELEFDAALERGRGLSLEDLAGELTGLPPRSP